MRQRLGKSHGYSYAVLHKSLANWRGVTLGLVVRWGQAEGTLLVETDDAKHRRSIRLKHRDYAQPDLYFVTICAYEKRCVFGRIAEACLAPNSLGHLARECWVAVPQHFPQVALHEFVIMPNHLHGILAIVPSPVVRTPAAVGTGTASPHLVGAQQCCALPRGAPSNGVKAGSLGAIVRSYKTIVARRAHRELGWRGPIWQRNYFERVLRDGKEFSDASRYIA